MFLKFFIDRFSEPWHNLIMVSDTQTLESKMNGTEKQITWANKIKATVAHTITKEIEPQITGKTGGLYDILRKAISELLLEDSAKYWIENWGVTKCADHYPTVYKDLSARAKNLMK